MFVLISGPLGFLRDTKETKKRLKWPSVVILHRFSALPSKVLRLLPNSYADIYLFILSIFIILNNGWTLGIKVDVSRAWVTSSRSLFCALFASISLEKFECLVWAINPRKQWDLSNNLVSFVSLRNAKCPEMSTNMHILYYFS